MSDKIILEQLDILLERQRWDTLDAVVDQYAKEGMSLQDLANMEQAARDVQETGNGGFWSNLAAAGRSLVSNEYFRVNYVLYHAGEKLGLNRGLIGTDGKLSVLDGSQYSSRRLYTRSNSDKNIALAQAKLNLLPQSLVSSFNIPQGGGDLQVQPEVERFYTPNARSLQSHNIADYRNIHPYADVELQGRLTRIYFEEKYLEQFKQAYPNAIPMKADGSGPLNPVATSNNVDNSQQQQRKRPPTVTTTEVPVAADLVGFRRLDPSQLGLRNNPEQIPAITELQDFLIQLGELDVDMDGAGVYGAKTRAAVIKFQRATDLSPDGDAGDNTIDKILEVRTDVARMQELIDAMRETVNSGLIPVFYKSSISKLLERTLSDEEKTTLSQLFAKYEKLRTAFPTWKTELFTSVNTIVNPTTSTTRSVGNVNDEAEPRYYVSGETSNGQFLVMDRETGERASHESGVATMYSDRDNAQKIVDALNNNEDPMQALSSITPEESWYEVINDNLPLGWPEEYALWKKQNQREYRVEAPAEQGQTPERSENFDSVQDALAWANNHKQQNQPTTVRDDQEFENLVDSYVGFMRVEKLQDILEELNDEKGTKKRGEYVIQVFTGEYGTDGAEGLPMAAQNQAATYREVMVRAAELAEIPLQDIGFGREETALPREFANTEVAMQNINELTVGDVVEIGSTRYTVQADGDQKYFVDENGNSVGIEAPEYNDNYDHNLAIYLKSDRSVQETEKFIEAINLESLDVRGAMALRDKLNRLRGVLTGDVRVPDEIEDIGGDILRNTPLLSIRKITDFKDEVSDLILRLKDQEIAPVLDNSNIPDAQKEKAQQLYNAMAGMFSDKSTVREIILGIETKEEFGQIDQAFRLLSDGEGVVEFFKSQWFFSTVNIEDHLRELGVAMEESASVDDIIRLSKRLLER